MRHSFTRFCTAAALIALPTLAMSYQSGPPDGVAGNPPNRSTCVECHTSFALNSGRGNLALQGVPEGGYKPDSTYRFTINLSDPDAHRWGFEVTVIGGDNRRRGTISVADRNNTQLSGGGAQAPQYLKQTRTGTFAGQANAASWAFNWRAPADSTGPVTFYFAGNAANNNGGNSGDHIYAVSQRISQEPPPPPPPPPPLDSAEVTLADGWNLVGSSVAPVDSSLEAIFAPLIQAGTLIAVFDQNGHNFEPPDVPNGIGSWLPEKAFQVKVVGEASVEFRGRFVDPRAPVSLPNGWNWVAYTRPDTLNPQTLIDALGASLAEAKDGRGRFAKPDAGVSSLGMITPGAGLMLKIQSDSGLTFRWPLPDPNEPAPSALAVPEHYSPPSITNRSMSLIVREVPVEDMTVGEEIGVKDDAGMLVGSGVWEGSPLAIGLWGDDPTTRDADGAGEGAELSVAIWHPETATEESVDVTAVSGNPLTYSTDSFETITLARPNGVGGSRPVPTAFGIESAYPNPFNSTTTIRYSVPSSGPVTLSVYNLAGRQIATLFAGIQGAGVHSASWSGEGFPSGIFICRMEAGGFRQNVKLVLVR